MFNVTKLHRELANANIAFWGVAADGRIDFRPEATPAQRIQAAALLAAHDPIDQDELRREAAITNLLSEDFLSLRAEILAAATLVAIRPILLKMLRLMWRISAAQGYTNTNEPGL